MNKVIHYLRHPLQHLRLSAVLAFSLLALLVTTSPALGQTQAFKVLIMSRCLAFCHTSIGPGITAIQTLGSQNNFGVDSTTDPTVFNTANLAQYQAIIFLSTTGDVLIRILAPTTARSSLLYKSSFRMATAS